MTPDLQPSRAFHQRSGARSCLPCWPGLLVIFALAARLSALEPVALALRVSGEGTNKSLRLAPVNHPAGEILTIETTSNWTDWRVHYWLKPQETSAVFPQGGAQFFRARRPETVRFTTSPASAVSEPGGSQIFRAEAKGYPLLGYSWHKAETPAVSIAAGQELNLANLQPEQSAAYVAGVQTLGIVEGNVTIVSVYSRPFYLQIGPPGPAPLDLDGRVLAVTVTQAFGVFSNSGLHRFDVNENDQTYTFAPLMAARAPMTGTLVYYCKFSPAQGRMIWADRLYGEVRVELNFTSERTGSLTLRTRAGRMEGNFSL